MANVELNLTFEGVDGNAFALLAHFSRKAKEAGWEDDEIKAKIDEAMSGDYNKLVRTLSSC